VGCANEQSHKHPTVGKIFPDAAEAQSEKHIQEEVVHKLDPESKFTVKLLNSCSLDIKESFDDCPHIVDKDSPLSPMKYEQLIYAYGGISLDTYLKNNKPTPKRIKKLLEAFLPIFEGIKKLNFESSHIHQDIKPTNILVDTSNKHLKVYLVDFGLMTELKLVYTDVNNFCLNYPYPYYPPEYKLGSAKSSLDNFKKLVNGNFQSSKYITIKNRLLEIGVDFDESLKRTFEHRVQDTYKIDSYSLGIVLVIIYNWGYRTIKKNPSLLNDFNIVVRALCHQDSQKRKNSKEAYLIYKKFVSTI